MSGTFYIPVDSFQEKYGIIYLPLNTSKIKTKNSETFKSGNDQVASYPLKVIASPKGIDYGKTYEEILATIKNKLTFFSNFKKVGWNYLQQKMWRKIVLIK